MFKHPLILLLCFAGSVVASHGQYRTTTYAGNGSPGKVNGDTSMATFNEPFGICMDPSGNLFIADGVNHCIRKISADGIVSNYAGSGSPGYLDGPDSVAMFQSPSGVCADNQGNLYVADFLNHRIRKISSDGTVSTVAGTGTDGFMDGPDTVAQFNYPRGIGVDGSGNLYVGDSWNHRIRKITPDGTVSTLAGGGGNIGVGSVGDYVDGGSLVARFYTPAGINLDQQGNIYVADAFNHRIRKVLPSGLVSTVAGSGATGQGNGGFLDSTVDVALLNTPTEVFIDGAGNIYIGDTFNNRVRKLDGNDRISTLSGNATAGFTDGEDTLAALDYPRGITGSSGGDTLFVVDHHNHAIRKIVKQVDKPDTMAALVNRVSPAFKIYPNPNTGNFGILLPGEYLAGTITIRDILGKPVHRSRYAGQPKHSITLSLAPGIYFCELKGPEAWLATQKLVVR